MNLEQAINGLRKTFLAEGPGPFFNTTDDVVEAVRALPDTMPAAPPTPAEAQARVEVLEAALKPFAEVAGWYDNSEDDTFEVWSDYPHGLINRTVAQLKHFRRAAAYVTDNQSQEGGSHGG